jgi:DNA-binding NtrC family response regulator
VPETLFEAELFGHEKGVFTDAKSSRQGLLETAEGGTVFLDEIGDMPLAMQAKLLVVIETGRFRRLGSNVEQNVDMRVIAAASPGLDENARSGRFREDLYHRLGMFRIEMPPLHDRGQDLFRLADYFLDRFSRGLGRNVPRLPDEVREYMRSYTWPGNVRELAHALLRALTNSSSDVISSDALGLGGFATDRLPTRLDALEFDFASGTVPLAQLERRLIKAAFEHAGGNVTEAARLLGMPRQTLRYRLEKMGMI